MAWFKFNNTLGTTTARLIITWGTGPTPDDALQAESGAETVVTSSYAPSGDTTKEIVYNSVAGTFSERDKVLTSSQTTFFNRATRDKMLGVTDWQAVSDIRDRLTYSQWKRLTEYRRDLRAMDLTPASPTWPTQPPLPTPLAPEAPYQLVNAESLTGLTFTRAGGAWYIDRNGTLRLALNDKPRIEWDFATDTRFGLLMEPAATNLCLQSHSIGAGGGGTPWNQIRATPTLNATAAPDGTNNATKMVEDTSVTQTHQLTQNITLPAATQGWFGAMVKMAERTRLNLIVVSPGMTTQSCVFNASTGVVLSGSPIARKLADGWYWLNLPFLTVTGGVSNFYLRMIDGAGSGSYTGDGTSGIYVYAAQVEMSAMPTSPIVTLGSAVTRPADSATYTFVDELNHVEFSLYLEARWNGSSAYGNDARIAAKISDGSNANVVGFLNKNGRAGVQVRSGSADQALFNGATNSGAVTRAALGVKLNSVALSIDGASPATDLTATMPVGLTTLELPGFGGHINDLRLYRSRLTDAQLVALAS